MSTPCWCGGRESGVADSADRRLPARLRSDSENETIAAGLNDVVMDHLVDVVDRDGQPELVYRSGNCTGYFEHDDRPYEPYLSASGAVLSIIRVP